MFAQKLSLDSTKTQAQVTESQGGHVEVTGAYLNPAGARIDKDLISPSVLRALNVPHIKTIFGGKREYFVTIAYQATTKKEKKTKKTKSVQSEGQTAVWNQTLDPL
jgi:hypothetical protein